jgi:hypothetical protein
VGDVGMSLDSSNDKDQEWSGDPYNRMSAAAI